jgi:hypothetical protein
MCNAVRLVLPFKVDYEYMCLQMMYEHCKSVVTYVYCDGLKFSCLV